ncbi:lipase [Cupriavidus basilensis OR16]|uniref:Lipase n=1 Tax=Cupriavidus basilensis OR16 TaxID=1127483 RepID=H1S4D6_9BURK|nr:alpha/beta hydrolase [Cupriavidus basilensis]EHP42619.1 lipase [Cupriavidus basilensis OR16]
MVSDFDLWFEDLPARNRLYNARASVADFEACMREYAALSAQAKARCPGVLDVAYGPGEDDRLDIFPASAATPAPALIYIHGGYWRSQRKEDAACMAASFTDAGVAVVVLEYTLLPAVTLFDVVRQVRAAVAWLHRHAADYGIDARRLHVCGSSAGAHLAAMLLADGWQQALALPRDVIKGMVGLSGLYDIRPLCATDVNDWLRLDETQAAALSPALLLPRTGPQLLLAVGELETRAFVHQTLHFHAACAARGLPVRLVPAPGLNHFNIVNELGRADSLLFRETLAWIA